MSCQVFASVENTPLCSSVVRHHDKAYKSHVNILQIHNSYCHYITVMNIVYDISNKHEINKF